MSELEHTKSLNLAFGRGDGDGTVLQNLKIFASEVGFDAEDVISLPQIHSNTVFEVGLSDRGKGYYIRDGILSGDGYVTDERGVVLGIKTADCTPILFEAVKNGEVVAVGAVHAGWRGTAQRIAQKCARMLCEKYGVEPRDIRAAIGPCIHSCCYEVGQDLFCAMSDSLGENVARKHVTERGEGKYSCDLVAINRELLEEFGLLPQNVDVIDLCTCCNPDKFFSHRYSGGVRGTMLNVIFKK